MIKIRRNVFETNSSSSHSLAFSRKGRGYNYDLPVDEDGILVIPFGEFGWGPNVLKKPIDKLSYYITDNCAHQIDLTGITDWDEVEEKILKIDCIDEVIDMIKRNCPNVKEVHFSSAGWCFPLGYVDHQSAGTSHEDNISAEELIFSRDVVILIDNDERHYFSKFFSYGCEQVEYERMFEEDK